MPTSNIPNLLNAVSSIIHDKRFTHGTFEEALAFIIEHASDVMGCQRVSAWEYHTNEFTHIKCLDLWDKKEKNHSRGAVLNEESASTYLNSLTKDLLLSINDVNKDHRCKELNASYLPSFGISSMLDAPFQYDGNLAGVLCFEHTGKPRTWTDQEQIFAANMAGLLSILTERRERHLAEKELQVEKNRYLQLFHNSPYGIAILSDNRVELVNPALLKILKKIGLENIQGQLMEELLNISSPENLSQVEKLISRKELVLNSPDPLLQMEYNILLEDGEYLHLGISSRHINWEGKDAIISNIQDITETVNNRKSLEQHAAQLQALADSFPGGFSYVDRELTFVLVNEILCQWFATNTAGLLNHSLPEFMGAESFALLKPYTDIALAGQNVTFEWAMQHPAADKREVQFTFVPDIDEGNKVKGFFSFILDLTDTRNYEKSLRQAQKMEAVGQLTGGIAHDFNNLLMIIIGNLEILASEVGRQSSNRKYIDNALQASNRGAQLTSKLLGFSVKKTADPEEVNINNCINNISDLLNKSLTASITVNLDLDPELKIAKINSGDLEDSILNLALNSRDAMHGSGILTITTENRNQNNAQFVVLSVTDTGDGIDEESKDKVFEPFFTTKSEGKGSGLGLSMVYGFVQRTGGEINLISEKGKGTTFEIYFPVARKKIESPSIADSNKASSPGGSETILVVDDEKDLLVMVTHMLERKGYSTLSASSAREALDCIESHGEDIDMIFSDIVLGEGMDGYQLALECLEQRPTLKILLTSGYNKLELDDQLHEFGAASRILKKPYQLNDLARSVRRTLDASES